MNLLRILIALLFSNLMLSDYVHACSKSRCDKKCSCEKGKSCDKLSLSALKKLAGYWLTKEIGRDGKPEAVIYKTTSGGTVVQEILFPGTDHEMISMYTEAGNKLAMTHYCALGNQPQLSATRGGRDDTIVFEFAGGSNIDPSSDQHMHQMRLHFLADNHIRQEWVSMKDGKQDFTKVINLHRQQE